MITRRGFLSFLACLPAITALAGTRLRVAEPEHNDGVALNSMAHPVSGKSCCSCHSPLAPYFTSPTAWYIQTEHNEGLKTYERKPLTREQRQAFGFSMAPIKRKGESIEYDPFCNCECHAATLSEESLEEMLIELRKMTDDRGIPLTIRPTHLTFFPRS